MAHGLFSDEYENAVRVDCKKLYHILKSCEGDDEESVQVLCKIVCLITNRQKPKMVTVANYTTKYLCQHPGLPIVLVEILRETYNIKICAYVLEILTKLIIKNPGTPENDRKTIRRAFSDPTNFKSVVDAFQKIYSHFIQDKTNPLFYDIQLRLLKIINCLYVRKGQTQISLLNEASVEFVGRHLTKYKAHREISQSLLPLIKLLCRNKRNCALMCNDNFLNSIAAVVTATNKYPTAITILKLLSRSPEAVVEMSESERTFQFILDTANNHADKAVHKKYLMNTLYRITKPFAGVHNISKPHLWSLLLDFFVRVDCLDELKLRLAATKAFTILNRGVQGEVLATTPLKLNFRLPNEIQTYIAEKSNHHSDDSDNEESEDEDDNKEIKRNERATTPSENDDTDESEDESDDNNEDQIDEKPQVVKTTHADLAFAKPFYQELFTEDSQHSCKTSVPIKNQPISEHGYINKQAFPDAVLADSDTGENSFISPSINFFSNEEMARKMRQHKGFEECGFVKRTVFDLDFATGVVDVPGPGEFNMGTNSEYVRNKNASTTKQQSALRSIKLKRDPPVLHFESRFECGNLRKAEQVADCEYNLHVSPDVNMTNGLQWFYFQVSKMLPGEAYTFNIVNLQKVNSQFIHGLQPVMFSIVDYMLTGAGWRKAGENVVYFGNSFRNHEQDKQFRTLSFRITFQHESDYCYLAYHFPYTFTRLMATMVPFYSPREGIYSRVDRLTTTITGLNEVHLITVTASRIGSSSSFVPLEKRPLVFLTARVHPGESNASWIMDGILQFILSQNDERAIKARERYIFKIIPMLNPEGVIYGNSRCGLTGNDLNRCWKRPHGTLHPEIFYAKKLVQFAKERLGNPIFTFVDIHGHSRKKYFFLYGCNPKQSWCDVDKSIDDSSDGSFNILPKALSSCNENMKMSFCRYTIERKKESTCRVVMWREFGIKCSYTLECSFCAGENKKKITTKTLRDIGISIITALASIADSA